MADLNPLPGYYWGGRISNALGEAGFAYVSEMRRHGLLVTENDTLRRAVWLGYALDTEWMREDGGTGENTIFYPVEGRPCFALGFAGETNILTIGSAGSGKNACAIMPTLMTNEESAFVNDIKGENWWVTHAFRKHKLGQRIICINPFNLFGEELGFAQPMTSHYNPLAALSDGKHPKFGQRISGLASALIVVEGNDPHWPSRARDVVSCLMAIVATSPDEQRAGTNHLPRVMDLLSLEPEALAEYVAGALKWCNLPMVVNNAQAIIEGGKEFSSIKSTAKGQLSFLNDPALRSFLSKSDFDFSDLRKERMTIYCMIPPAEMQTYFRFARVLVQACLDTLAASPMTERDSVLVILDEQAKLRGMEVIETSAATLRGYNVRIWSVYQDVNQIKRDYEKSWETFVANAGLVQILSVNDETTAEYFSRKAGEYGQLITSISVGASSTGATSNNTQSYQKTRFLTPQQLYGMGKGASLSFVQGLAYPVLCERLPYYDSNSNDFSGRFVPPPDKPRDDMSTAEIWDLMKTITKADREAQTSRADAIRSEFYRGRQ